MCSDDRHSFTGQPRIPKLPSTDALRLAYQCVQNLYAPWTESPQNSVMDTLCCSARHTPNAQVDSLRSTHLATEPTARCHPDRGPRQGDPAFNTSQPHQPFTRLLLGGPLTGLAPTTPSTPVPWTTSPQPERMMGTMCSTLGPSPPWWPLHPGDSDRGGRAAHVPLTGRPSQP